MGLDRKTARATLRAYLRDKPELNALTGEREETDDVLLDVCLLLAVDDWNCTPPRSSVTIESHPCPGILILNAVLHVLLSAGIGQARNQFDFSDGGISVATSNKSTLYQSWYQQIASKVVAMMSNYKKSVNADSCWDGVWSEYAAIGSMAYTGTGSCDYIRYGLSNLF